MLDSQPKNRHTRDEKDINSLDQFTGRLLGSWNVTDDLKISGFAFGQKTDIADISDSRNRERPERSNHPFPSPRDNSFGGAKPTSTACPLAPRPPPTAPIFSSGPGPRSSA